MRYLVIDNLNDYSSDKFYERKVLDNMTSMIVSYINNTSANYAKLMDASLEDFIPTSPIYSDFEAFVIHVVEDNIFSALRLKEIIKGKYVFFFSIDYDLSRYFLASNLEYYFNFETRIDLQTNLNSFATLLSIDSCLSMSIDALNKCIIDRTNNCMYVNVAMGCRRRCSFCVIAETDVDYFEINHLIKEIKLNLENGVKYFHINSHGFTHDLDYVKRFCKLLIDECGHLDFKWSCFVIPENIIHDLGLLTLFKESHLERIELGVENINESICRDFNLVISEEDILNIIDACTAANITSIAINYIIGSPEESTDTLQLSSEFINKLTYNTMGMIDINLYFFYPDIGTKYDNCFKTMNDRREIIDKCVRRKQTCLLDTKHLIKNDIYSWKWNMLRKLSNECLRFINQLTPRQRLGLFILSGYGIKMQIGVHLLNTSISRLFDDNRKRKICYFYDDIKECIDSYAPRLVSENHVFVDDKNEVFTNYDKIYSRKEDIVPINISEFGLYESMLAEKSIKDIFDNNDNSDSDNTLIQDAIINRLRELENMHLLFYIQLLK